MKNKWEEGDSNSKDDSIDSDFDTEKPAVKFDVDNIISQLLSAKVRNAGIITDIEEGTIIELIARATDIITA
jgi:hypothetical protein